MSFLESHSAPPFRKKNILVRQLKSAEAPNRELALSHLGLPYPTSRIDSLSVNAVRLLTFLQPMVVTERDGEFIVIANHRTFEFVGALDGSERVPVWIVDVAPASALYASLYSQGTLLGLLVNSLSSKHGHAALMGFWNLVDEDDKRSISPKLLTKSGFAALTGINRRAKEAEPQMVRSEFGALMGEEEGEAL